jgi:magnesium-transporting ATPase (P-type)
LSIVIAVIALVFFGVGFAVKIPTIINLNFVMGFIIANVPLTLSLCLIFILGQSVKKLGKKGILLKNYDAIETLSKLTCICVDKTGTLT